jgi:hypothetical protein
MNELPDEGDNDSGSTKGLAYSELGLLGVVSPGVVAGTSGRGT